MDPNACLSELRALVRMVLNATEGQVTALEIDLAEHVDALDGWMSGGGFRPAAWGGVPEALGERD